MSGLPPILPDLLCAAAVGLPLLSAMALAIPRWRPVMFHLIPWAALPALAAAGLLPEEGFVTFRWVFLQAKFGVDATGRLFLFVTSALWLLAGVFGTSYLAADRRRAKFFLFYALAMSGNLGLILSQDMVGFYVFFTLMGFASYGLVVHTGDPDAVRAGRVYITFVVTGEILLFSGLLMLAVSADSLNFVDLKHATPTHTTLILVLVGFGIKVGALPLHVWLPLAYPAAPTPASAVLSGAMINAGLLGWLRFIPAESVATPAWGAVCILAGLTAAFYGVAVGVTQSNPKTILAYSSISQMGLITVGFGIALWNPASAAGPLLAVTLYAVHHGFAKGALFIGVGLLATAATGSRASKVAWTGLALAALSLAGAPLTSGAVAKAALKSAIYLVPQAWQTALAFLLPIASAGTTVLMGRLAYVLADRPPTHGRPGRAMWLPWIGMLVLVAASLFVLPGAKDAASLSFGGIKASLWPVTAGGALTALGWTAARRKLPFSLPRLPAGDIVVFYSAAVDFLFRIAGSVEKAKPGVFPVARAYKGLYEKAIVPLHSVESSGAKWQTSGFLLLLLVCGFFLYFIFMA